MSRTQVGRKVSQKYVSFELVLGALRIKTSTPCGDQAGAVSVVSRETSAAEPRQKSDVRAV